MGIERSESKDSSVVRLLLEHGADINVQTYNGRTPLHTASYNGALEVVRVLLEHRADIKVKSKQGETALQEALRKDMKKSWNYCENLEPSRNTL